MFYSCNLCIYFLGQPFKGFCQVIVNRQELKVLDEEKEEFKSVFKDLGFYFDEVACKWNDDVEGVIEHVVSRDYGACNLFVCFVQSCVTEDWNIKNSDGRTLDFKSLLAKFTTLKSSHLVRKMPKIFIIQGHKTITALATVERYDWKSSSDKLLLGRSFPVRSSDLGEDFLCLFVPYEKGYISTLLSIIKLPGSRRRDISGILLEAKKQFYKNTHVIIPDPIHNLTVPVCLGQETR